MIGLWMLYSRIGSELGIVLTVPRLSEDNNTGVMQVHAENPDPEVYNRINVAIPFLDHMEEDLDFIVTVWLVGTYFI